MDTKQEPFDLREGRGGVEIAPSGSAGRRQGCWNHWARVLFGFVWLLLCFNFFQEFWFHAWRSKRMRVSSTCFLFKLVLIFGHEFLGLVCEEYEQGLGFLYWIGTMGWAWDICCEFEILGECLEDGLLGFKATVGLGIGHIFFWKLREEDPILTS